MWVCVCIQTDRSKHNLTPPISFYTTHPPCLRAQLKEEHAVAGEAGRVALSP